MKQRNTYLSQMDTPNVDSEEWIRDVRVGYPGDIGEGAVDDERRENREQDTEPDIAEAAVGVKGRDGAVRVAVPEEDMLLEDRLVIIVKTCQPYDDDIEEVARNWTSVLHNPSDCRRNLPRLH